MTNNLVFESSLFRMKCCSAYFQLFWASGTHHKWRHFRFCQSHFSHCWSFFTILQNDISTYFWTWVIHSNVSL